MNKKKTSILFSLGITVAIPTIILGIILIFVSKQSISEAMEIEIQNSLTATARETVDVLSLAYPGMIDYRDGVFYMGDADITGDYTVVDHIKENTGNDITVFWGTERMLTTIIDSSGKRLDNTVMTNEMVWNAVSMGNEYYAKDIDLEGQLYYGYYVPLYNQKVVCGMVFAGLSSDRVAKKENTVIAKMVIIIAVSLFLTLFFCGLYTSGIVKRLKNIDEYMSKLADNNTNPKIAKSVYQRNDEIADMGKNAEDVGGKLQDLIYKDPLTSLFNRRAGRMELLKYIDDAELKSNKKHVTVALGDIDFFKKVNDQYGHDIGDEVLIKVSEILKKNLVKIGAPIRWGGEEFLIAFNTDYATSLEMLNTILDEIRSITFTTEEKTFQITMTFGITSYRMKESIDEVVKRADLLLYEGKTSGRNKIVEENS